ncbi:MAG: hypothetical protein OXN15_04920 [Chloroflexota bacterium]|nr:hypothetical protein [Chloroflexota bacterium]MDE2969051.1 hypothetical protein [Chloroflexota bacterium]
MPEETTRRTAGGFYVGALTEEERRRLARARRVEGLDEEIAVLRMCIYSVLEEYADDLRELLPPVAALARLVALRYRISPESKQHLADNLAGVLTSVGAAMGLEGFDDAAA